MELDAFRDSTLKLIAITRNTEVLCSLCFSFCQSLSLISSESSLLSRIESIAFAGACVHSVSLPESIVFIAGDAFPRSCEIRISNIDSSEEFNEWKERVSPGQGKRVSGMDGSNHRREENENEEESENERQDKAKETKEDEKRKAEEKENEDSDTETKENRGKQRTTN
jgi:hypothetical protein